MSCAVLAVSLGAPDPFQHRIAAMERTHVGHVYILVGGDVERNVQLELIEEILAERLEHARVPNQVTLKDRGRRKRFEEIRLQRVRGPDGIVEAFDEVLFLRPGKRSRGAVHLASPTLFHSTSPLARPRV